MKARTNLTVDKKLLKSARLHGIVLSPLLEKAIKEQLRLIEEDQWKKENAMKISEYNNHIKTKGVFSDGMRSF
jgi:post-segregation antitoxin (ccd killing protein)